MKTPIHIETSKAQRVLLVSPPSTSIFLSITIYGTRRFARAEDRRRLAGFDWAWSRRLAYDSNCR
jgi:hypothetical protein